VLSAQDDELLSFGGSSPPSAALESLRDFLDACEQRFRRAMRALERLHWSIHISGAMLGISVVAAALALLFGLFSDLAPSPPSGGLRLGLEAAPDLASDQILPRPEAAPAPAPKESWSLGDSSWQGGGRAAAGLSFSREELEACVRQGGQNCFDGATVTTTVGVDVDALLGARPASTTPGPPGLATLEYGSSALGPGGSRPGRRGPPSTTVKPGTRIPQVVAEYLRQVGLPDVWTTDSARNTVLHLAVAEGRFDVIHALLGSSVFTALDAQDGQGNTALHIAAQRGHFQSAVHIMRCGRFTQVAKRNFAGRTAFHLAASSPMADTHGEVALLLLQDLPPGTPDQQDNRGRTALHLAALSGHRRLVRGLMTSDKFTAGAKQDRKGMTALHCAVSKGHAGVVEMLLQPRVPSPTEGPLSPAIDVEARDSKGRTALDMALALNSVEAAIAIQVNLPAIFPGPSMPTATRAWPLPFDRPTERTVLTGRGVRPWKWKAPSNEEPM